jgi:hypothetical protein
MAFYRDKVGAASQPGVEGRTSFGQASKGMEGVGYSAVSDLTA